MCHKTLVFPPLATGQAIVECAHGTIKCILDKQKDGMCGESPQSRVTKAIYTLNHLTVPEQPQNTVILNYFLSLQAASGDAQTAKPKVMIKDYVSNKRDGLWDLITWGHGCVVFLWTLEHDRYLPGVSALPYILFGTRDNTLPMLAQQTLRSSDLHYTEIWDFLR